MCECNAETPVDISLRLQTILPDPGVAYVSRTCRTFLLCKKSRSRHLIANRQPHQSDNPTNLVPPRHHIQDEDVRRQLLGPEDLSWKGTVISRGGAGD